MPLSEIIGELIVGPIVETILYGLTYCAGYVFLKGISLGNIRLAPLSTIGAKEEKKSRSFRPDMNIWVHVPTEGRALTAECTCIIGLLVWVAIAAGIYFAIPEKKSSEQAVAAYMLPATKPSPYDC
jgi:hypothetical protein